MSVNRWVGLANQCFLVAYQLKRDGSMKWAIATTYLNGLSQRLIALACFNGLFQCPVSVACYNRCASLQASWEISTTKLTKASTADTLVRQTIVLQTIDAAKDWVNLDGQAYLTLQWIYYCLTHVRHWLDRGIRSQHSVHHCSPRSSVFFSRRFWTASEPV